MIKRKNYEYENHTRLPNQPVGLVVRHPDDRLGGDLHVFTTGYPRRCCCRTCRSCGLAE
ncbi:MAG: hypothetical protein P8O19_02560 [Woeseiaceae bacterium]|nr:hypothetical protein [Woeseiaceae bacterium]